MVTIVCVKVGQKYGPEYVARLAAMVARHATHPYRFLCLTNDPKGVDVPYTDVGTDLPGWWAKLVLFRPHPALAGQRVVYLDLDTVIVGSIDFLFEYAGPLCVLKDWWAPGHNTSVMSIAPGVGEQVWRDFQKDPTGIMARLHGDQDWLTERMPTADAWQNFAPRKIGSYKADHLEGGPGPFSIACLHGEPKPSTFTEGWVHDAWIHGGQRLSVAVE